MSDSTKITETVDVVVVGAGASGLMAAIEAAEAGANVVILQKLANEGGKSSLAIGSISAAGTAMQRARGIDDDHDAHWRDLCARIEAGGIQPLSMHMLEIAVRNGAAAVGRLIDLGVRFTGPHPELANETWRMHVLFPNAAALVETLAARARERSVEIRGDWVVDELVMDGDRVAGVRGARGAVLARGAVILASGDFSAPGRLADVSPVGSQYAFRPWSTGDGQLMARSVGAEATHLDRPLIVQLRTQTWPYIEPSPHLFTAGAILVDSAGRRVVDELDRPGAALASAADPQVYIVAGGEVVSRIPTADDDSPYARDAWLRDNGLYVCTFPGIAYAYVADVVAAGYGAVGASLAEVAAALGIDAVGLTNEVASYNAAIDARVPDPLGRSERGDGLRVGPYFGLGPLNVRAILGRAGLRTDDRVRVLDSSGEPISGLFAVGAAAGATGFAYGHGYELAWAVVSGRIAGTGAAALVG